MLWNPAKGQDYINWTHENSQIQNSLLKLFKTFSCSTSGPEVAEDFALVEHGHAELGRKEFQSQTPKAGIRIFQIFSNPSAKHDPLLRKGKQLVRVYGTKTFLGFGPRKMWGPPNWPPNQQRSWPRRRSSPKELQMRWLRFYSVGQTNSAWILHLFFLVSLDCENSRSSNFKHQRCADLCLSLQSQLISILSLTMWSPGRSWALGEIHFIQTKLFSIKGNSTKNHMPCLKLALLIIRLLTRRALTNFRATLGCSHPQAVWQPGGFARTARSISSTFVIV